MQLLHVSSEQGEQSSGRVAGHLTVLALQQLHQEVDIAHGQAQDLILAQFLLWRMGRNELAELSKGRVDIVLAPALSCVGEYLSGHYANWSFCMSFSWSKSWLLKGDRCPLLQDCCVNVHSVVFSHPHREMLVSGKKSERGRDEV